MRAWRGRLHFGLLVMVVAPDGLLGQTWDGGGTNNNWTTAANWNPDSAPANNGSATVVFGGVSRLTPAVDVPQDVHALSFDATAGAFVIGGPGTLTLRSGGVANLDSGTQTIAANVVLASAQTWNAAAGPLVFSGTTASFASATTLSVTGFFDTTLSAALGGGGALTKSGSAALVLGGANTYAGPTSVLDGILRLSAAERLANTSALIVNGGAFDVQAFGETVASVTLIDGALLGSGTLTADTIELRSGDAALRLGGAGGLTKTSPGLVLVGGANTYTGATQILGGTLQLNVANERIPNGTGVLIDNGTFALGGRTETVQSVQLVSGAIAGPGTLISSGFTLESGSITATLAGNVGVQKVGSSTLDVGAACTYTGPTTIAAGILRLSAADVLPDTTALIVNPTTTFDLNGFSDSVDSVTLPAGAAITLGGATLSVGAAALADSTLDGAVSGVGGGLTKLGSRTLVLNTAATYSGATTVAGGVFRLGASNRLADSSDLTVSGGTFDLQAFNETLDVVQLAGGTISGAGTITAAVLDLRSGAAAVRLAGPAAAVKTTPGVVTLSGANTYSGGTTVSGGTLAIAADACLGAPSASLTLAGGALRAIAPVDSSRPITIGPAGGTLDTLAATILRNVQSNGGGLTKSGTGTLVLDGGPLALASVAVNAGELRLRGATLLGVAGAIALAAPATLALEDVVLSGASVTNDGLIVGHGTIAANVSNVAAGELSVDAGDTLALTAATNTNAGLISLLGGTLRVAGTLTNQAGGLIAGDGVLRVDGGLTNSGALAFSGAATVLGDVTNAPGGRLITTGGAITTYFDDVTHSGAEIRTAASSASVFFGALSGPGPLTGTGTAYVEGDLRPGSSPARVTVAGDLVLGASATVEMELGGPLPGTQHDQLAVAGSADLAGRLRVVLLNGYVPPPGATFTLLTFGARSGTFATLDLPVLPGATLSLETTATAVRLHVTAGGGVLRGDANCDGNVDFFDIDPFLLALFNLPAYEATFCGGAIATADVDCSSNVDFFDIDPFLACLFSACLPCP